MPERPDVRRDVPMSAKDLAEVRGGFSMLSTDGLRHAYADALERCRLDNAVGRHGRNTSRSWYRRGGCCGEANVEAARPGATASPWRYLNRIRNIVGSKPGATVASRLP
jgi:hypothetical protein